MVWEAAGLGGFCPNGDRFCWKHQRGSVNAVLLGVQAMFFAGGVWLAGLPFGAEDVLTAIQLGFPVAAFLA